MNTIRNEVINKAMRIKAFEVADFGSTIDIVIVDYNTEIVGGYLKWLSDIAGEVINDYYTTYKFENFEVSIS